MMHASSNREEMKWCRLDEFYATAPPPEVPVWRDEFYGGMSAWSEELSLIIVQRQHFAANAAHADPAHMRQQRR
jgi:hypothetical protein